MNEKDPCARTYACIYQKSRFGNARGRRNSSRYLLASRTSSNDRVLGLVSDRCIVDVRVAVADPNGTPERQRNEGHVTRKEANALESSEGSVVVMSFIEQ
jgi:hypothetical protein